MSFNIKMNAFFPVLFQNNPHLSKEKADSGLRERSKQKSGESVLNALDKVPVLIQKIENYPEQVSRNHKSDKKVP